MDNVMTGRMSQKDQIVIPTSIREALGLTRETELSLKVEGDKITVKKLPTALDWTNLVGQVPVKNVEIDKGGHYNPKKSPEFHDWVVNG